MKDRNTDRPSSGAPGTPCPAAESHRAHPDPTPSAQPPFVERRKAQRERRGTSTDDAPTGLERRRGPGRRLTDYLKAAEEGHMNGEQFLFLMAIDSFKKANNAMYPTWTDVLEVVRLLGYRKTQPSQLKLNNAEDWVESADAPSNVRTKPGHPEREAA